MRVCITYLELASAVLGLLRLHEPVELRQQRLIANNGRRLLRWCRGRRDVCFGGPEREDVPGKLVREAHDGGEQGIGGFGALAERKRPQSRVVERARGCLSRKNQQLQI